MKGERRGAIASKQYCYLLVREVCHQNYGHIKLLRDCFSATTANMRRTKVLIQGNCTNERQSVKQRQEPNQKKLANSSMAHNMNNLRLALLLSFSAFLAFFFSAFIFLLCVVSLILAWPLFLLYGRFCFSFASESSVCAASSEISAWSKFTSSILMTPSLSSFDGCLELLRPPS